MSCSCSLRCSAELFSCRSSSPTSCRVSKSSSEPGVPMPFTEGGLESSGGDPGSRDTPLPDKIKKSLQN